MTAVLGRTEQIPELRQLLEHRQALGLDTFDELWNGIYHIMPNPAPEHGEVVLNVAGFLKGLTADPKFDWLAVAAPVNIGRFGEDYRVPDIAVYDRLGPRTSPAFLDSDTAWLVVEVLSPGEEPTAKFDFYYRYGVAEILTIDWTAGHATLYGLAQSPVVQYGLRRRSTVLPGLQVVDGVLCGSDGAGVELRG